MYPWIVISPSPEIPKRLLKSKINPIYPEILFYNKNPIIVWETTPKISKPIKLKEIGHLSMTTPMGITRKATRKKVEK